MKKFLLTVTVLMFSAQAFAGNSVRLMTEEFAPYQFYEGEGSDKAIAGISIEIVQAIQERIGNGDDIKVLPWSRALKLLAKNKNSVLFSTARTPAREDKYKWVGPLSKLEMVFLKRPEAISALIPWKRQKKSAKLVSPKTSPLMKY